VCLQESGEVPSLLELEEDVVERFDRDDVEFLDAEGQLEQFRYVVTVKSLYPDKQSFRRYTGD